MKTAVIALTMNRAEATRQVWANNLKADTPVYWWDNTPHGADLFLAVPSGDLCGLFIEMKTETGRQSTEQREFEADAVGAGYGYAMPRSVEQFAQIIDSYLQTDVY